MNITNITSKSNVWFRRTKELSKENKAYREHHKIWIEGEHLCLAAIGRGWTLDELVVSQSQSESTIERWSTYAHSVIVISDQLMNELSSLGSASWVGAVVQLPDSSEMNSSTPTVVLDRLQDPGNAGSILRSAAAFGFKQVITTPNTVALWSSKVVRSAMGAHFGLHLFEAVSIESVLMLKLPILLTSSHQGDSLKELTTRRMLPWPCLWVLGHEGQGLAPEWFDHAHLKVRIEQPGGEESLNVAAAAAILFFSSSSQTN